MLLGLLIGATGGFALGAVVGALVTLFNNAVLVPRGQAAEGSYAFWVPFFGWMFAIGGTIIGGILAFTRGR
jgi:hypothetical protein